MSCLHRTCVALAALMTVPVASIARGGGLEDPLERARNLFVQAEQDEDAERWSDALDKLRSVSQVRLTAGVRYHMALCEQHLGKLAHAYAEYEAAENQARLENAADVLRLVGAQLAALKPRVPRLTIHVAPFVQEMSLKLDGQRIAPASVGAAIPVDPGEHRVEATAPDRPGAAGAVTLQEGESRQLDLRFGAAQSPPATQANEPSALNPPSPAEPSKPAETTARSSRPAAAVAAAIGIGLAGAGVAAFFIAGNERDRAVDWCGHQTDSCGGLVQLVRTIDFLAAAAWTGAAISGAAAIVLWTKRSDAPSGAAVSLTVGPGTVGASGRF